MLDIVKITVTDQCGARCTTCPQWQVSPRQTMTPSFFRDVLEQVMGRARQIVINGTGDYLSLANHQKYSDVLRDVSNGSSETFVVTNGGFTTHEVPRIWAAHINCSLNAVDDRLFEQHIGIAGGLQRVVRNIRSIIDNHGYVEVHSLVWEHNPDPGPKLLSWFGDTHARIRLSEKVDNQCTGTVVDQERVPCDYLDGLTILPDGKVRQCAHDWANTRVWGSIFNLDACLAARDVVREQHASGDFTGICATCNYNVADHGRIYWLKK